MYYSQSFQDKFINEILLKNKTKGTFLDIGAHDGISFSNSYFFEKEKSFTGICIEPMPLNFEKLKKNRHCNCEQAAVTDYDGEIQFTVVEGLSDMLSGISKNYHPEHLERIQKETAENGGKIVEINLPAHQLETICKKYAILKFDFCSIDVEGSELTILQTIDFDAIKIDFFCIEDNYKTELVDFLEEKKYIRIGKIGRDQFFMHQRIEKNFNVFNLKIEVIKFKLLHLGNKLKRKFSK